jgi:polyhydroxyalkanoate synthesis regulator phasin
MNLIDTLLPWGALKEARKEVSSLIKTCVKQREKIDALEHKILTSSLRIDFLKREVRDLKERVPNRDKTGRFKSKNACGSSAEASKETSAENS